MRSILARVAITFAVAILSAATGSAQTTVTVMTYNTKHGGGTGYATVDQLTQVIANQSPRPSVVVLQEVDSYSLVPSFVSRLNSLYNVTTWAGRYARHCNMKSGTTCTSKLSQSVVVLSLLPVLDSEERYFLYAEDYFGGGRAALRVDVQLPDATVVHVFSIHLQPNGPSPAYNNRQSSRLSSVADLKTWARNFTSPKLVGGDFNASPTASEISNTTTGMAQDFNDTWGTTGIGTGTGETRGTSRIDYWFTDKNGVATPSVAWVGTENGESDHKPVLATYSVGSNPPPTEQPCATGVMLCDDFGDNYQDPAKWQSTVFSGTRDSTISAVEVNQRFEIGPLKSGTTGSHYNGITSFGKFDLTNAFVYAQLVQAPSSTSTAYAMLTVGSDSENFYRFFVSGGALTAERKLASVKTDFGPYGFTAGDFLRIRHDGTNVVFETAANVSGSPSSTWNAVHSEAWDSRVIRTQLNFELKAGTSVSETSPGTVIWDNVLARLTQAQQTETLLLSDTFTGTTLDVTNKWATTLLSSGKDSNVLVAQNDRLEIGDLLQSTTGTHYNGITSKNAYDFTGAYAYVQVAVPPPDNTMSQWFFTMPVDASNHYRVYVQGTSISFEKKEAGIKTQVGTGTYDAVNQAFVRLRHDAITRTVVLEVAPNVGGSPGGWSSPFTGNSTSDSVAVTAIKFELKAGTDRSETNPPGTLAFDTFKAAKQ